MDQHFLPRPKFTTRRRTALFVRVNAVSREQQTTYRNNPIQLLNDALNAHIDKQNSPRELLAVWEALKAHAYANQDTTAEEGNPAAPTLTLSALLTEEAIRLLTTPRDDDGAHSPPIAQSQTSLPLRHAAGGAASGNSRAPSDWDGFTSAGFGFMDGPNLAGGLQDYTSPPTSPGKTKVRSLELGRRASLDAKGPGAATAHTSAGAPPIVSETVAATLLLDEALLDGWADTLADPAVSSAWPAFVLYHLKAPLADPTAAADAAETREHDPPTAPGIGWLVIETAAPASPPAPRDAAANGKDREKLKERRSSSRPRFAGLFSSSTSVATAKDKDKESKKKDKESTPGSRSSLGALKGAYSASRLNFYFADSVSLFNRCYEVSAESHESTHRGGSSGAARPQVSWYAHFYILRWTVYLILGLARRRRCPVYRYDGRRSRRYCRCYRHGC